MKLHVHYCTTCDIMAPADDVHSCFDAARLTQHREAERAVIEAAKEMAHQIPISDSYHRWVAAQNGLLAAVATLRELEGEA